MKHLSKSCLAFLFIVIMLSAACTSESNDEGTSSTKEVTIDTLYTFADFDKQNIATPSDVKLLSNGLIAVTDFSTQVVTLLDNEGKVISTFGRAGRGPGEFLNIRHLYDIENGVAVFDSHQNTLSYFDYDGSLFRSHVLPSHAINKNFTLINDSLYAINMEGLNGSLFELRSLNNDSVLEFGAPNVTWDKRGSLADGYNQLTSGEVPNRFKNRTILKSDGTYIYAFFKALSEIQKYDLDGNLIWHHYINLPYNEDIFNRTVESAKEYGSHSSVPTLQYIADFKKLEDNIYILTRKTLEKPQILIKLGIKNPASTIYRFPSSHEFCFDFDIDPETKLLYLTSCISSDVKIASLK